MHILSVFCGMVEKQMRARRVAQKQNERGDGMAGYTTEQYVNSSRVRVSFEVSSDDWCLIQQSETWNHIQSFLEESESKGSRMSLKEKVNLLEGEQSG